MRDYLWNRIVRFTGWWAFAVICIVIPAWILFFATMGSDEYEVISDIAYCVGLIGAWLILMLSLAYNPDKRKEIR